MIFTDLLTISMPCYERKDFFREALESALNQTVKCRIIVIDNCSSHNYYEEVCKEKGVSYYRNDRNIGMTGNFSKSFELSDTKYVMNLQDDDILHPEYVESFLKAVTRHPDIDIFFTDFEMNTYHGIQPHPHTLPFGYMENGAKIIEYAINYKLGFPYIASAIKRTKAHKAQDISEMIGSYDWEWIYSHANKLSFYGDPRKLYLFRVHDNQETKLEASNHNFSYPYIYDMILKENVSDIKLKKKASKNASWELFVIKSVVDDKKLAEFSNTDNKYSHYLKSKLNENIFLKTIFLMPKGLVMFIYKILRKVEMQFANI